MSALFTRCPGDTVQTGTGKVDPARKCTTAARGKGLLYFISKPLRMVFVKPIGVSLKPFTLKENVVFKFEK